jgi:hypothetical protein
MEDTISATPVLTPAFIQQFGRRERRRLQDQHGGLVAVKVESGWWIFKTYEYEIRCSCGWVDEKRVPITPPEMRMTTDLLVRHRMERHLLAVARG